MAQKPSFTKGVTLLHNANIIPNVTLIYVCTRLFFVLRVALPEWVPTTDDPLETITSHNSALSEFFQLCQVTSMKLRNESVFGTRYCNFSLLIFCTN